jgi:hypothetical protein
MRIVRDGAAAGRGEPPLCVGLRNPAFECVVRCTAAGARLHVAKRSEGAREPAQRLYEPARERPTTDSAVDGLGDPLMCAATGGRRTQ